MAKTSEPRLRRALQASLVGSTLEFYDYIIFGLAAALVFPEVFFPNSSPVAGILSSFATFAVGFVARPVGAVIAGHFGDRIGRRRVLLATLIAMGIATGGIGLLPTFEQVGVWAPVLLVLCRIVQGLSLGGEWSGSVLLAVEQNPGGQRKGFFGSIPQVGDPLGLLLANGAFAIVQVSVDKEAFMSWGWRVPFLSGLVIVAVGLWLRLRITETPEFERRAKAKPPLRIPLLTLLREQPRNFVLSMGCRLANDVAFYIVTVFAITYVVHQNLMDRSVVLIATMCAAGVAVITTPLMGMLADRIGVRKLAIFGLVALGVGVATYFPLLNTGRPALAIAAAVFTNGIAAKAFWAPYAGLLSTLFPAEMRFSGMSFSFQLAGIVGGGIAPFVAAALLEITGSSVAITVYGLTAVAISLICVATVRTYPNRPTSEAGSTVENADFTRTSEKEAIK
ncbi:MHS family MFS transporter [Mycobacterium sp. 21AC1]|uniref:MFS transporter n=1 Tax=[Mycobacterium] appelbergii TaxID=2939269 RepID=UPI0029390770|nr:MFS transporter [Mycobacterium sp. 21AC1]MDV3126045.1 MHS family MFS transporter [Mycobacterium sp. 21AC1]